MSEQNEQRERLIAESGEYPPGSLVTVAVFADPMTANLARMALQGAGITCFLQGENANSLIPVAFESQLQVRPEDEAAAREVLDQAEASPASEDSVTEAEIASENGAV